MAVYFLRLVGFPDREKTWLQALLTIANNRLPDEWRCVEEGTATIHLLAVESSVQWERYQADFPPDTTVACALPDVEIEARWVIHREPGGSFRLATVIATLHSLGEFLGGNEHPAATARSASATAVVAEPEREPEAGSGVPAGSPEVPETSGENLAADGYDPAAYLTGVVRESTADGKPRRLSCQQGGQVVLIDPQKALYHVPGDRTGVWPILSAAREQIAAGELSSGELAREAFAMGSQGRPLAQLLFLSVLIGSRGRLCTGSRPDQPVRLRQWPDIKDAPDYTDYVNLAAYMSGNMANLPDIAHKTGIAKDKVVGFHNACAILDLLERGERPAIRDKTLDEGIRALYRKIAQRLERDE